MNMEDYGFVESAEDAQKLITAYETEHTVKFACFKADKDFGKKGKWIICILDLDLETLQQQQKLH